MDTHAYDQIEFFLGLRPKGLLIRHDGEGLVALSTRVGPASVESLKEKYGDKIFDAGAHSGGSGRVKDINP